MTILCQKLDYAELLAQRHSWLSLSLALLAYALCAGWSSGEFGCIVNLAYHPDLPKDLSAKNQGQAVVPGA